MMSYFASECRMLSVNQLHFSFPTSYKERMNSSAKLGKLSFNAIFIEPIIDSFGL